MIAKFWATCHNRKLQPLYMFTNELYLFYCSTDSLAIS